MKKIRELSSVISITGLFTHHWPSPVCENTLWQPFKWQHHEKEIARGLMGIFMLDSYSELMMSLVQNSYYKGSLYEMIELSKILNSEIV